MTEVGNAIDPATLAGLRESVGGDAEFLAELIDELLADAPAQLESLRESASSGDAERARRAAHTLKGNGRTFGAEALAALCQEAEAAAAAGDLDAVLARLGDIDAEWARAGAALRDVRDSRA